MWSPHAPTAAHDRSTPRGSASLPSQTVRAKTDRNPQFQSVRTTVSIRPQCERAGILLEVDRSRSRPDGVVGLERTNARIVAAGTKEFRDLTDVAQVMKRPFQYQFRSRECSKRRMGAVTIPIAGGHLLHRSHPTITRFDKPRQASR